MLCSFGFVSLSQSLPFHWLGLIRTEGGPSAPQENKEQSWGLTPGGPAPKELYQQGQGAVSQLPSALGGSQMRPRAQGLGPSLAFPAGLWPVPGSCTDTLLSPGALGLALLLESPQHPSAGTGVLSPTRQWGNL